MIDEERDALACVLEIDEGRRLDSLGPQRAPEALDLAERLWATRRGDDLFDAALLTLLREGALPSTGDVLAAVA